MKKNLLRVFLLLTLISGSRPAAQAGHPHDPADPRPDFLPHYLYYAHDSYRKTYNRPRFIPGYLGSVFEPSSQEAMSFRDSYRMGAYGTHRPTPVAYYNFPKPWEALDVGPRRDSRRASSTNRLQGDATQDDAANQMNESEEPRIDPATKGVVKPTLRDPSRTPSYR